MDLKDAVVCDILDVVTVFSKKGRLEEMSNRKSYGISFTLDGQITYMQNGVSYVEDRNHAVLLPKNQSYTIRGDVEGTFPVINFDTTEFLTDTITVLPIDSVDFIYKEFEQMKNLSFSKGVNFSAPIWNCAFVPLARCMGM